MAHAKSHFLVSADPVVGLGVGGAVGGLGVLTLFAALLCALRRQHKAPLPREDARRAGDAALSTAEVRSPSD